MKQGLNNLIFVDLNLEADTGGADSDAGLPFQEDLLAPIFRLGQRSFLDRCFRWSPPFLSSSQSLCMGANCYRKGAATITDWATTIRTQLCLVVIWQRWKVMRVRGGAGGELK